MNEEDWRDLIRGIIGLLCAAAVLILTFLFVAWVSPRAEALETGWRELAQLGMCAVLLVGTFGLPAFVLLLIYDKGFLVG